MLQYTTDISECLRCNISLKLNMIPIMHGACCRTSCRGSKRYLDVTTAPAVVSRTYSTALYLLQFIGLELPAASRYVAAILSDVRHCGYAHTVVLTH